MLMTNATYNLYSLVLNANLYIAITAARYLSSGMKQ